jgi:hypothetical protein
MSHTPGKWHYHQYPDVKSASVTADGIGTIAQVKGRTSEEQAANARLIAAAPDLFAAARRALNVFKAQGESVRPGSVLGALDRAIAKVEGP